MLTAGAFHVRTLRRKNAVIRDQKQEAEELAQQAEAANEHKARFLANISHEFRTPLTFGSLDDLLNGRYQVDGAARPHLERARRNGSRLLRLIHQLLDLSKLDAGALLLRPKQQDLAKHLRQLTALIVRPAAALITLEAAPFHEEAFSLQRLSDCLDPVGL